MDHNEFAGKAIIITGAASGLGRSTALAFASVGARVALVDVNEAGLKETASLANDGAELEIITADLSKIDACKDVIKRTLSAFGRIDVLCNIAGILLFKRTEDATPDDWDKIFAVNTRAPYFLLQAALPHLIEQQGSVVNVASNSALTGCAYLSIYGASKAAIINLTKSLAIEFTKSPIRINAIAPGAMDTPMVRGSLPSDVDWGLVARYSGTRPASAPEKVSDLVLFLASSQASSVHGACYVIDSGASVG